MQLSMLSPRGVGGGQARGGDFDFFTKKMWLVKSTKIVHPGAGTGGQTLIHAGVMETNAETTIYFCFLSTF